MDFKNLYPQTESIHKNFECFCKKIYAVFEDRVKDQASKNLFKSLKAMESISESKFCYFYIPC